MNIKRLHSLDAFGIRKVSLSYIRIERLEDRVKPGVAFPHKHDFYQIMLVTHGSGWHHIDFKRHKVKARQLFLMKPGQMHSWGLSKNVKGYLVEFNHHSLNAIQNGLQLIKEFALTPDLQSFKAKQDYVGLAKLCEVMIHEFEGQQEHYDLCLQGYLTSFLIQVSRLSETQMTKKNVVGMIEKLKELIELNFKSEHTVSFYAKRLNIDHQALTMQLSRSIGIPPRQMIQDRILLEAKRYLAFSPLSIAAIGYELGFEDSNYFTRFFRQHEGVTPAGFRKINKSN